MTCHVEGPHREVSGLFRRQRELGRKYEQEVLLWFLWEEMVEVGCSAFGLASMNNLSGQKCKTVLSGLVPGPGVIRTGEY